MKTMKLIPKILIAYEFSGTFSKLYRDAGWYVETWDKQLDGLDFRIIPYKPFDAILAFPPCTHLAGSGARWWKFKGEDYLIDSLSMVDAVLRVIHYSNPKFYFIENPVGRLQRYLGKPDYYFHPYQFAGWADKPEDEAYTKKTCLWGKFKKPVQKSVNPIHGSLMHLVPPGPERQNIRSKTPQGFARAFFESNK